MKKLQSILSSKGKKTLNKAGEHELYASHFYKSAAARCQSSGRFGAQKFFEKESADEIEHYYKIRDFVNDQGDMIDSPIIESVTIEEDNLGGILSEAYDLEKKLYDFYEAEYSKTEDPSLKVFLHDMVNIQRIAVGEYGDLLARYSIVAGNGAGEILFDQELGAK